MSYDDDDPPKVMEHHYPDLGLTFRMDTADGGLIEVLDRFGRKVDAAEAGRILDALPRSGPTQPTDPTERRREVRADRARNKLPPHSFVSAAITVTPFDVLGIMTAAVQEAKERGRRVQRIRLPAPGELADLPSYGQLAVRLSDLSAAVVVETDYPGLGGLERPFREILSQAPRVRDWWDVAAARSPDSESPKVALRLAVIHALAAVLLDDVPPAYRADWTTAAAGVAEMGIAALASTGGDAPRSVHEGYPAVIFARRAMDTVGVALTEAAIAKAAARRRRASKVGDN